MIKDCFQFYPVATRPQGGGVAVCDLLLREYVVANLTSKELDMGNQWRPADRIPERTQDLQEINAEHERRVANLEAQHRDEFQEEVREEEAEKAEDEEQP